MLAIGLGTSDTCYKLISLFRIVNEPTSFRFMEVQYYFPYVYWNNCCAKVLRQIALRVLGKHRLLYNVNQNAR